MLPLTLTVAVACVLPFPSKVCRPTPPKGPASGRPRDDSPRVGVPKASAQTGVRTTTLLARVRTGLDAYNQGSENDWRESSAYNAFHRQASLFVFSAAQWRRF